MIKNYFLICIFLWSCNFNSRNLTESIRAFDSTNKNSINRICSSLIQHNGRKRSYVMKLFPAEEEDRFMWIDSLGNSRGHFLSSFKPSRSELQFLVDAGANAVNYYNKTGVFFIRLTAFKTSERTLWLHVNYDHKKIIGLSDSAFLKIDNRFYVFSKN